jgi:hypothetical protein
MRKTFFLITCFVCCATLQTIAQIWPKTYNNFYAQALIESYDNGYLIAGPESNCLYGFIIKTDINGNLLWQKKIGNGQGHWYIESIEQSTDGGLVISGGMNKYDQPGYNDPFVMKLNVCGALEWCTVIKTSGIYDYAKCAKETTNHEIVLLTIYSAPNPNHHTQLFKFDSAGGLIWRQNYPTQGSAFEDTPRHVFVEENDYLISGECYYPDPGIPGGYERPYYIKTDTEGNVIWRLVYGSGNGYHGFPHYEPLKSVTGYFYDIGWHSNNCDKPAMFKFSASGEELYFQDLFPEACPGGSGEMNFINDTTLVVMVGGTVNGVQTKRWIKTDTNGLTRQFVIFPQGWMNGTEHSVISFDNKIVSSSSMSSTNYFYKLNSNLEFDSIYTMPRVYDSLCPYAIVSDTIDPDCGLVVGIQEPETNPAAFSLRVYPNPATNMLTVEIPRYLQKRTGPEDFRVSTVYHQWGTAQVEVYDLRGIKIFELGVKQGESAQKIDVSQWQPGLYIFRLMFRGECVGDEKVVVE